MENVPDESPFHFHLSLVNHNRSRKTDTNTLNALHSDPVLVSSDLHLQSTRDLGLGSLELLGQLGYGGEQVSYETVVRDLEDRCVWVLRGINTFNEHYEEKDTLVDGRR